MTSLDALWQPIDIGPTTLRNRVVVSAHERVYHDGTRLLSDRDVAYFEERARGGAALVTTGAQSVHWTASHGSIAIEEAWRTEAIPRYERLATAVQRHGARVFAQLAHFGQQDRGTMFLDSWHAPIAPSPIPSVVYGITPRAADQEEIAEIVEGFAISARNARIAGLDGVEINAGHGYLLCEFLSPLTNRRSDEYGGSTQNRCRFLLDVLKRVREVAGEDYPVGVRLSFDEFIPGAGLTPEESSDVVRILSSTGLVDYMNVSSGNYHTVGMMAPPMAAELHGHLVLYAAQVKEIVGDMPVLAVGGIIDIADAARAVQDGSADLVAMTRAHIADPDLVRKAQAGRPEEIRRCFGVNQGCINRMFHNQMVTCTQNPIAGREREWGYGTLTTVTESKRVAVIGGGPAGLRAAGTAAARGHAVTLFEQSDQLGGQVRFAAQLPHRGDWQILIDNLVGAVQRAGVDIRLDTAASVELLRGYQPDEVILATGSGFDKTGFTPALPHLTGIHGLDHVHVVDPLEAITDPTVCGRAVLIVDDTGDYLPLGLAGLLAQHDRTVSVVSRQLYVGEHTIPTLDVTFIFPRLAAAGVRLIPQVVVQELSPGKAVLASLWGGLEQTVLDVDTVVLTMGRTAHNGLEAQLRREFPQVHAIGDCRSPRYVDEAIYEGEKVARAL